MKSWPGYVFALLLEAAGYFAEVNATIIFLSIFIGSCWILTSMAKEITDDLQELNMDESGSADQAQIQSRFCSISKRLTDVKQLSLKFQRNRRSTGTYSSINGNRSFRSRFSRLFKYSWQYSVHIGRRY